MTVLSISFPRLPARVFLKTDHEGGRVDQESAAAVITEEMARQLSTGLTAALNALDSRRRQAIEELQQAAVELAVAAAESILQSAIDRDLFPIDRLVQESISELSGRGKITIRLNEQDLELLTRILEQADDAVLPDHVELVADSTCSRGSCVAEAESLLLVSDVRTRLESIRQIWLENLDDART